MPKEPQDLAQIRFDNALALFDEFVRANERFIAEGCSSGVDICPSTEQELSLANALTIDSMNFGTASTFLPFVCRQPKR